MDNKRPDGAGTPPASGEGKPPANGTSIASSKDAEHVDRIYQVYAEQRKILLDAEQAQGASFDKWILTLSGGAIAISLTLVKDLIGTRQPCHPWLLGVSWMAMGVAVASELVSIYGSQRSHERYKDLLDETFIQDPDNFLDEVRKKQDRERWPRAIGALNISSVIAFVIGLITLCTFAALNLSSPPNSTSKENKSNDASHRQQEGSDATKSGSSNTPVTQTQTALTPQTKSATVEPRKGEGHVSKPDPKPASTQPTSQTTRPPTTIQSDTRPMDVGAGSIPPKAPAPPKPIINKDK